MNFIVLMKLVKDLTSTVNTITKEVDGLRSLNRRVQELETENKASATRLRNLEAMPSNNYIRGVPPRHNI